MPHKRIGNNRPPRPAVERFWPKVDRTETCWVWKRSVARGRYGSFYKGNGVFVDAHRFSYELHFGPIPDGLWVLHRCDNPPCIRPDHLFLGTAVDNVHDMMTKGRRAKVYRPSRPYVRTWLPHPTGEENPTSKLTDELVRYIRAQVALGRQQKVLAAELDVSKMTVSRVVRRELWKHVT